MANKITPVAIILAVLLYIEYSMFNLIVTLFTQQSGDADMLQIIYALSLVLSIILAIIGLILITLNSMSQDRLKHVKAVGSITLTVLFLFVLQLITYIIGLASAS